MFNNIIKMGVPGAFAWFIRKFGEKYFIKKTIEYAKILLLDANCLFYPQCIDVLNKNPNWKSKKKLHKKMCSQILTYMKYLANYVNPEIVYIAVDGPVPLAKINQQRNRRFKSVLDNERIDNIKKKNGKEIPKKWDTMNITPGTKFMKMLMKRILRASKDGYFGKRKIIFSSSYVPEEGEQKIFKYLKKHKKIFINTNIVIYGLDADLIYLSLAKEFNIFLLRESTEFNEDYNKQLIYVDISVLKKAVCETMFRGIYKQRIVNDFIFISYFLGNDFLPSFVSINIRDYGIDTLIRTWRKCYLRLKEYIIDTHKQITINMDFLKMFINELANREKLYLKEQLPNFIQKTKLRKCHSLDKCDKEIFELQNMINMNNTLYLGQDDWKKRYYEYYNINNVKKSCSEYIRGLYWIANYYFLTCCSWEWFYPYMNTPLLVDLQNNINLDTKFNLGIPLEPFEQLTTVIPPQCAYLLPKNIRFLIEDNKSPIIDLYPKKFKEDTMDKTMLYQCTPFLPPLDIYRIKKALKKFI